MNISIPSGGEALNSKDLIELLDGGLPL